MTTIHYPAGFVLEFPEQHFDAWNEGRASWSLPELPPVIDAAPYTIGDREVIALAFDGQDAERFCRAVEAHDLSVLPTAVSAAVLAAYRAAQ